MSFLDKLLSSMGNGHHGSSRSGHHGNNRTYPDNRPPYQPPPSAGPPFGGPQCSSCSAVNSAGARFCAQCGKSLTPGICNACNAALVSGAKFCASCGKPQA